MNGKNMVRIVMELLNIIYGQVLKINKQMINFLIDLILKLIKNINQLNNNNLRYLKINYKVIVIVI